MKFLFISVMWLLSFSVNAGIAVFVHGYQSNGHSWRSANVMKSVVHSGWQDAGGFSYQSRQIVGPQQRATGNNLVYTVDLPNNAPIMYQVDFLHAVILSIRQFAPKEPISLVGHSAGGIVARTLMVRHLEDNISQLITIASPNLGTAAASAGSFLASSPVGIFARMAGETKLSRSGQLLSEMAPQSPDNFLGWLNSRFHPKADYLSIIRTDSGLLKSDGMIKPASQDLRNVWALRGRAESFVSSGSHSLKQSDGDILAALLLRTKASQ